MDAATAGATTDAALMGVATTAGEETATEPDTDTVIEGDAALQVAAAIAPGSVEVDFAAIVADSTAEIAVDSVTEVFAAETVSTVAEAVAFVAVVAVIAVEDPAVVAIGNLS